MEIMNVQLAPNNARLTCYLQDKSDAMPNVDIRPAALVLPKARASFTDSLTAAGRGTSI